MVSDCETYAAIAIFLTSFVIFHPIKEALISTDQSARAIEMDCYVTNVELALRMQVYWLVI
jgi:hypothetical protein